MDLKISLTHQDKIKLNKLKTLFDLDKSEDVFIKLLRDYLPNTNFGVTNTDIFDTPGIKPGNAASDKSEVS